MEPLDKCMSMLRVLISDGNAQALALAEGAIDEFVAAHVGIMRKSDALAVLEGKILDLSEAPKGPSEAFANLVLDHLDDRIVQLQKNA
jgi:hypothetical protein